MVYGWGSEQFLRYNTFYEMKGWGMVYGWGSEQFLRYNTFYEMKGWGIPPGDPFGIHGPYHLMRLIIRNKDI